MAIAGLHNVSVLDSSFLRESQPETVRQRDDDGRTRSTRASSLLQMWRELEDEHVVSHAHGRNSERSLQQRSDGVNSEISILDVSDSRGSEHSGVSDTVSIGESDYGQWSPGPIGSENGQEDSSDLGENERERVRQIFREWMNAGAQERTSNVSRRNNGSRAEWLGETEQERVRVIREWVHMNTQDRGPCAEHREEQSSEVVGQIEQVLDGSVVNRNEGRPEQSRRGFRRLCGRQALLDMLKKSERERQRELQGLLGHRAVSQFAHRGRIQSLLRGRFLRNDRLIEDGRPTSVAASELGLLRQRHTVSDLREGFFSRLDHSTCIQESSSASDMSSNNDVNNSGNENYQESNTNITDGLHEQIESNIPERTDVQVDTLENTRWTGPTHLTDESRQFANNVESAMDHSDTIEIVARRNDLEAEVNRNSVECPDGEPSQEIVEIEARESIVLPLTGEVFLQQPEPNGEESPRSTGSNHVVNFVDNAVEDVSMHEAAAEVERLNQNLVGEETVSFGVELGAGINGHESETPANELMDSEEREAAQVWHEDDGGFQEQTQDWLDEPSDQDVNPVGRMDSFYFPDDDNVYSMELRELVSRRSVSTLLRSGFRESLDQLIRSYVERQSHTSLDWEGQGASPTPASAEQELEQRGSDENEGLGDAVQSPPLAPPPPRLPPVQHLWGQDTHHYDWAQHDMHNRFGIDWDVINDLRIDMARLQQRMNNMQRMLEACMDMQLELQRSIRQEVSAALNRSAGLSGDCENGLSEDRSKWDHVRKGMCCICCDSSIDSLLYRCGHMCTCSKCANKLVQEGEKCPMCRAPVIEVIRAYSIM